jgi:ribosomal protein S18 acetylase RimI-like enzyme
MIYGFTRRNFRKGDLPRIIELRRQGIRASFPGRELDERKFRERLLKAAKKETESIQVLEKAGKGGGRGELIGYIWFGLGDGDVGKYGFLRQIFIRKDFRKRGLAEELLAHAEKYLASKGAKSMRLMVTDANFDAVKFYGKMNYRKARLMMEKDL